MELLQKSPQNLKNHTTAWSVNTAVAKYLLQYNNTMPTVLG